MHNYISWAKLKILVSSHNLRLQYIEETNKYKIFAFEDCVEFACELWKNTSVIKGIDVAQNNIDLAEFESNYKPICNLPLSPKDTDGRIFVRAESRPLGTNTNFAIAGDTESEIGGDTKWLFDFSNNDNDVSNPPSGYKQKKLEFTFIDNVWLKEGTLYWENMPFGSFMELGFAVPNNGYYYANEGEYEGQLKQNLTGNNLMVHRFAQSPMMGNCPMGDELNTEASSDSPVIPGTIGTILITVPDSVPSNAHCAVQIELYRERTIILE